VAGRATRGSLDNTCLRVLKLDDDFTLVFPTAKYRWAAEGDGTLGRGVTPDVHLPWTPEQLVRDVDLDAACALARAAR
jgi:C-terminal processing protease CtpA/Prc